ncbi:MAG: hypothetical protein ACE5GR_08725 [Nitrosopumilus sp.]
MKVSLFKLGLGLTILGIVWISFVFVETEKTHDEILLKQSNSFELKSEFTGVDIGFYKVYMPEFSGEEIFLQILDTKDNVIQEQKIQTRMSVGYFDYSEDGTYTVKITNISKNQINLQVEFGNTNSHEMIPAGVLVLVGAVTIIVMSYFKIKNYNMAQPDENIS